MEKINHQNDVLIGKYKTETKYYVEVIKKKKKPHDGIKKKYLMLF